MVSIKLMVVFVVLVSGPLLSLASDLTEAQNKFEVQRCGIELAKILTVICKGRFNGMNNKRSGSK